VVIKAGVESIGDGLSLPVSVTDGLGAMQIQRGSTQPASEIRLERMLNGTRIRALPLLRPCHIKHARLRDCRPARVRCHSLLSAPASRSLPSPAFRRSRVRRTALGEEREAVHDGIPESFTRGICVRDATQRIRIWPHRRKVENSEEMSLRHCESFLHEAEVLRDVPHGEGELLGIFRHVPIEVVGKMRYLEKRKLLVYTLVITPELRRTRVHDVAVVRDRSRSKIEIVAHRTRYRTAFLG